MHAEGVPLSKKSHPFRVIQMIQRIQMMFTCGFFFLIECDPMWKKMSCPKTAYMISCMPYDITWTICDHIWKVLYVWRISGNRTRVTFLRGFQNSPRSSFANSSAEAVRKVLLSAMTDAHGFGRNPFEYSSTSDRLLRQLSSSVLWKEVMIRRPARRASPLLRMILRRRAVPRRNSPWSGGWAPFTSRATQR